MQNTSFKVLPFLTVLSVTIIITANILIFRMTEFFDIEFSSGAFLIPLWFMLSDVITEVYGYTTCKKVIWYSLCSDIIFGIICFTSTYLPVPNNWDHFSDYEYIVANQLKVSIILFGAVTCGGFINSYLVAKWKILLSGKYFWLRCLGASWIGQLIFSVVTITFNFYDKLTTSEILGYLYTAYIGKMFIMIILIFPVVILVTILKKIEKIGEIDSQIKFNPFSE